MHEEQPVAAQQRREAVRDEEAGGAARRAAAVEDGALEHVTVLLTASGAVRDVAPAHLGDHRESTQAAAEEPVRGAIEGGAGARCDKGAVLVLSRVVSCHVISSRLVSSDLI